MTPLSHQEKLDELKKHLTAIRKIARRLVVVYGASYSVTDDAVQSASLYMWKALGRFDRDRGVQVMTYCYPWIKVGAEREIQRHVRYLRRMNGDVECEELSRADEAEDCAVEMVEHMFSNSMHRWMDQVLTPAQKLAVVKRLEGKTLRDAGKEMALTHERVRQLTNEAMFNLRRAVVSAEGVAR